MSYYNDNDKNSCRWLLGLMLEGLIEGGTIDDRGIEDVRAEDLLGHERVHFFAGIGGWEAALQLAGWTGPVWTGSCPCQPFSLSGKREGEKDKRHLWPEMRRLIAGCLPPVVFGEQVAGTLGREWLSRVRAEMEALGYAFGCADLCAAGVGAPHIRQRLWWVAHRTGRESEDRELQRSGEHRQQQKDGGAGGVGDVSSAGPQIGQGEEDRSGTVWHEGKNPLQASPWSEYEVVRCRDGKARRFEPGSFPLAHGVSARVAKLRGLGNAIVPQVAAEFIQAFMEVRGCPTNQQ